MTNPSGYLCALLSFFSALHEYVEIIKMHFILLKIIIKAKFTWEYDISYCSKKYVFKNGMIEKMTLDIGKLLKRMEF